MGDFSSLYFLQEFQHVLDRFAPHRSVAAMGAALASACLARGIPQLKVTFSRILELRAGKNPRQ
jgi:hypothetical protein